MSHRDYEIDQLRAQMHSMYTMMNTTAKTPIDPIKKFSTADLIMELIERGYAVGLLNEENKLET